MPRRINWENRVGRRFRFRDLHVFFTVVQSGSMAKAAAQLGVSSPTVSEVIADLEHAIGVRLFDRSPQGVEPTKYGDALLRRGLAAFDELKQGIRDIEFLADPTSGELTIGYPESVAGTVMRQMIERFFERYPRVIMRADIVPAPVFKFSGLRDRTHDLILARMPTPLPDDYLADDTNVEVLFDDPFVVAVGTCSRWARRRKINLAELVDEPWILPPPNTWSYARVAEAFKALGLEGPKPKLVTYAMDLRANLPASGRFITVIPKSMLTIENNRPPLKILPVHLPMRPWPVTILTLKNRSLSPVVERFIECAREVAKSIAGKRQSPKS
jgi:DNA-binding transcriptional LysR family regulator